MGLMEDLGAWLDQKKKNVVVNAQNLPGLLSSFTQDVQQGAAADKSAWDASRSVMPEVRAQGVAEMNQRGQELGAMAPAGLLGWTAWHGSPHKFDKFDLSKIGTGEGAQAYGHGLYYADNAKVAKDYAERLAIDPRDQINEFVRTIRGPDGYVSILKGDINAKIAEHPVLGPLAKDKPELFDDIRKIAYGMKPDGTISQDAYRTFIQLDKHLPDPSKYLYKVDISDAKAPQDAFLQWDKPLSEQPKVLEKLRKGNYAPADDPSITGEQFHKALQYEMGGNADEIAGLLRADGIPGIRYLDGGSRGAGSGTMNTVLFDDSLVKILERNGQPLGLLGR